MSYKYYKIIGTNIFINVFEDAWKIIYFMGIASIQAYPFKSYLKYVLIKLLVIN